MRVHSHVSGKVFKISRPRRDYHFSCGSSESFATASCSFLRCVFCYLIRCYSPLLSVQCDSRLPWAACAVATVHCAYLTAAAAQVTPLCPSIRLSCHRSSLLAILLPPRPCFRPLDPCVRVRHNKYRSHFPVLEEKNRKGASLLQACSRNILCS